MTENGEKTRCQINTVNSNTLPFYLLVRPSCETLSFIFTRIKQQRPKYLNSVVECMWEKSTVISNLLQFFYLKFGFYA